MSMMLKFVKVPRHFQGLRDYELGILELIIMTKAVEFRVI